jgi:hypothetical protein
MPRLDQLKIAARIGIACLIPMLAFTGFAIVNLIESAPPQRRRQTCSP